jgi:hypothetical protein
MEEPIEIIQLKDNHELRIYQDTDTQNPRTEWDNFGHMACWHRSYNLGDCEKGTGRRNWTPIHENTDAMLAHITGAHPDDSELEYKEALADIWDRANKLAVILPLRLFDHSGISMSVGSGAHPFDPGGWDSGQVGWIYATEEDAKKNWGIKSWDETTECDGKTITYREYSEILLRGEVETYDQYLTGDVYGFVLVKKTPKTWVNKDDPTETVDEIDEEEVDSCWGFFGSDWKENGITDHIPNELIPDKEHTVTMPGGS